MDPVFVQKHKSCQIVRYSSINYESKLGALLLKDLQLIVGNVWFLEKVRVQPGYLDKFFSINHSVYFQCI